MGLGVVVGLLVNGYGIDWASTKGLLRTGQWKWFSLLVIFKLGINKIVVNPNFTKINPDDWDGLKRDVIAVAQLHKIWNKDEIISVGVIKESDRCER